MSYFFQGADGFPVSTPTGYVPQPNQGANQGPGLRGIAPTVPPNQASTPPNADIKVQTIPQPPSMSHMVSGTLALMKFVSKYRDWHFQYWFVQCDSKISTVYWKVSQIFNILKKCDRPSSFVWRKSFVINIWH